jgi:hypothetical protein
MKLVLEAAATRPRVESVELSREVYFPHTFGEAMYALVRGTGGDVVPAVITAMPILGLGCRVSGSGFRVSGFRV